MDRAETGRAGERASAMRYIRLGCTLLEHNYHTRFGEIDLILRSPDGELILCEVKTRSPRAMVRGAAAVDSHKQRRLILAAQQYLQQTNQSDMPIRFDVAEVVPLDSGRWMVHIIKGAFVCEGPSYGAAEQIDI